MNLSTKMKVGFQLYGDVFGESLIKEICNGGVMTEDHLQDIVNVIFVERPIPLTEEEPPEVMADSLVEKDKPLVAFVTEAIKEASDKSLADGLRIKALESENEILKKQLDFRKNFAVIEGGKAS